MEDTIKRNQNLAERFRIAADSLDAQAQDFQQQVPHGMLQ